MNALKHLTAKHLANQQIRYPNTPAAYIPRLSLNERTEKGLAACILAWFIYNDHRSEQTGKTGGVLDSRKQIQEALGRSRVIGSISSMEVNNPVTISVTTYSHLVNTKNAIGCDEQAANDQDCRNYIVATSFQQFYDWYLTMLPAVAKKESGGLRS